MQQRPRPPRAATPPRPPPARSAPPCLVFSFPSGTAGAKQKRWISAVYVLSVGSVRLGESSWDSPPGIGSLSLAQGGRKRERVMHGVGFEHPCATSRWGTGACQRKHRPKRRVCKWLWLMSPLDEPERNAAGRGGCAGGSEGGGASGSAAHGRASRVAAVSRRPAGCAAPFLRSLELLFS